MKKAMKKLMAALLAVAMVCAMAIPAFADNNPKEDLGQNHCYDAFQIFKGDVEVKDGVTKISNVKWSESIRNPEDFLESLKNAPTISSQFSNAKNAQDVLTVISRWHDSDNDSIAFARFVCKYIYTDANADWKPVKQGGHTNGFQLDDPGYYLIVDTSSFSSSDDGDSYHAYNSFLLTVSQKNYHFQITPKVVKPTVKKEVFDNDDIGSTGDNKGWGSSADHAINEEFKFRLIATLPASENNGRAYDYYDKYTVLFHDTLSEGITFDRLDKVEITSGSTTKEIEHYLLDKNSLPSSFTLRIEDVKTCVADAGFNLNNGATITVTYTAHLNDKAAVNSSDNKNSVRLQYSNNPKPGEHWGYTPNYTPESEVYVYTYQLNNTKYHDKAETGNELAGAGFRLYSAETCNKAQEIKLKKNTDGTYSRYFGNEDGEEMFSNDKGQFNVKGLDAGTYYLKETTTPAGYHTCGVTTVTIKANHTGKNVDLTGSTINGTTLSTSNLSTTIINNSGTVLPSTGGIGTTIFYVVGGGLMVAAAILLITKKRMENH